MTLEGRFLEVVFFLLFYLEDARTVCDSLGQRTAWPWC